MDLGDLQLPDIHGTRSLPKFRNWWLEAAVDMNVKD